MAVLVRSGDTTSSVLSGYFVRVNGMRGWPGQARGAIPTFRERLRDVLQVAVCNWTMHVGAALLGRSTEQTHYAARSTGRPLKKNESATVFCSRHRLPLLASDAYPKMVRIMPRLINHFGVPCRHVGSSSGIRNIREPVCSGGSLFGGKRNIIHSCIPCIYFKLCWRLSHKMTKKVSGVKEKHSHRV